MNEFNWGKKVPKLLNNYWFDNHPNSKYIPILYEAHNKRMWVLTLCANCTSYLKFTTQAIYRRFNQVSSLRVICCILIIQKVTLCISYTFLNQSMSSEYRRGESTDFLLRVKVSMMHTDFSDVLHLSVLLTSTFCQPYISLSIYTFCHWIHCLSHYFFCCLSLVSPSNILFSVTAHVHSSVTFVGLYLEPHASLLSVYVFVPLPFLSSKLLMG